MKHLLSTVWFLSVLLNTGTAFGQNFVSTMSQTHHTNLITEVAERRLSPESDAHRAWVRSLAPLIASQALDVVSSYGLRELNPMLAGPDGRFGARAATVKVSFTAAAIGIQYWVVRRWPRSGKVLSRINWGGAALTGSIAAHNFALR